MPDQYGRLTYNEFADKVEEIYSKFPENLQVPIHIQEKMPLGMDKLFFGFYKFDDKSVVLCYWGFKAENKFSDEHITNVIKHELNHLFEVDKEKGVEKDRKDNEEDDLKNSNRLIECPKCKEKTVGLFQFMNQLNKIGRVGMTCHNLECDFIELMK